MAGLKGMSPIALERPTVLIRDQVAAYLRDAITAFRLRPGTTLVEREICEATGTSRATVREALRQLESEGLVVADGGRGMAVASLTRAETRQIYEVRGVLEGLATRLFTATADDEHITALRGVVDEMSGMTDDPAAMLVKKSEFYEVLFAGAGNDELYRLWSSTRRRATLVRATSLSIPGRARTSLTEIQAIVDAIEAREPDRAAQLCVAHIEAAAEAILTAEDSHFAPPAPGQAGALAFAD
jgi:GntR family transcriptional regulator, trigonelline degradation regulator